MRYAIIITTAALITTLPACTSTTRTTQSTTHSITQSPTIDECRTKLTNNHQLTKEEVAMLFATQEGRDALQSFAQEFDTIYFDNKDRFVQRNQTVSFFYGETMPSLTLYNGWLHPEYFYTSNIMLRGAALEDPINIEFAQDTMHINIDSANKAVTPYTIEWIQNKMSPWAIIDHEIGKITYQPPRD